MEANVRVEECTLMLKKLNDCNSERFFNQSFGPNKLESKLSMNNIMVVTNSTDQIKNLNLQIKSLQDYINSTFAPKYFKYK